MNMKNEWCSCTHSLHVPAEQDLFPECVQFIIPLVGIVAVCRAAVKWPYKERVQWKKDTEEEMGGLITYLLNTALPDFQHKEEPKPQYS